MSDTLTAISACLAYTENHLREAISVADLAAAAGYSLYHFERTFNKTVHHTPYDYLIRRRLSACASELVHTRRRITDIAADSQFQNTETFSRAFKRMFGLQPNRFRAEKRLDPRFLLKPRTLAHLQNNALGDFLHPNTTQYPERQLAGWVTRLTSPDQTHDLLAALREAVPNAQAWYGVTLYPPDWIKNGAFYLAAVEIPVSGNLLPTFVRYNLPAGVYVAFTHPSEPECLALTRDYACQTWLPRVGKTINPHFDLEIHNPNNISRFVLMI